MKKYGLIFIVFLLLTASMVFNYNLNKKFKVSASQLEMLEAQLQESKNDNNILNKNASSLKNELINIDEQLHIKEEALKHIDVKLEADGRILERIDELLTENSKLMIELNSALLKLNILEVKNSKIIEEETLTASTLEQWDSDIQDILEFINARISVLEDGIRSLPSLSLERIMVKQEIDFLKTTYLDITKLKNDILEE